MIIVLKPQVKLFEVPRGGRWYFFQYYTYANLVRAVSAVHVFIAVLVVLLLETGSTVAMDATALLMWFLLVDLILSCVWGTSPTSAIGVLCTYMFWNYRGPSVSTLPYKVVFVAYIVGIATQVTSLSSIGDWSDESRDAFAKATRARCIGIITNSLALAGEAR